jgi:adsorption protein B
MTVGGLLFGGLDFIMRETALFAATGFLVLGAGDLLMDFLWTGLWIQGRHRYRPTAEDLAPQPPGRLAVFIPAWDESAVIGSMLRRAVSVFDHSDYRLYVGAYPNDPATIAEVEGVQDRRIRLVVGPAPGPTTKADCLNGLWKAMLADEAVDGRPFKAVVLHDAEDVVHKAELWLFDRWIGRFDLVQLPVLPLIDPNSRWIGAHYCDEFAQAHGKEMVVRAGIGASVPSAGVGCAFSRKVLTEIAARSDGCPFDAESLTEDYELGLKVKDNGGRIAFVRMPAGPKGGIVATREYFPGTIMAAVSQKARWMTGIALAGWDRMGWSGGPAERWMRLRDRQTLFAALLLFTGYFAVALWLVLKAREGLTGIAPAVVTPLLAMLVRINFCLLIWRLAVRAGFVTRAYGWREGLRSIPRAAVGNLIAILAAWKALARYRALRRTGRATWDKTAHMFPTDTVAE